MPSLILRPRYSTIAGCQPECDLRSVSIRLPANRYFARAVLNRFSPSSFSACCADRYALRKISLGSSCCPTTAVAQGKSSRANNATRARFMAWRASIITEFRGDFCSTGGRITEDDGESRDLCLQKEIRILDSFSAKMVVVAQW